MADYLVACHTLAINLDGKMRALHLGDSLTGDGEPFESLEHAGFLTQGTLPDAAPADDAAGEDEDEKPQDGEADEPAPGDDAPVEVKPGEIERPKQTGTVDEWRAYAESLGIKTAGLKKNELIAATR